SQQDVCSVIGIAPQTYSGYENGKHEPTIETLVRLAYLYGVSLDFLLSMFSNSEDDNVDLILHNTENNEAFQDLRVQIHIMKEEIDILRKKINAK
ncbi:MAG: helix-turn-helix transcriptional regulator, partial [Oscillospiraceae bacterium]